MNIKANNLEDAIEEAIKIFNCEKNQLNIKTLKSPSGKLMGFIKVRGEYEIDVITIKSEAEVKAELINALNDALDVALDETLTEEDQIKQDKVEIRQDEVEVKYNNKNGSIKITSGIIVVENPEEGGRKANIRINSSDVDVFINDEKMTEATFVTEQDKIEFKPNNIESSSSVVVVISEDKLLAELIIEKIPGKEFFITDVDKSFNVLLNVEFNELPNIEVTLDECIKALDDIKIFSKLVDINAINELISLPEGGRRVVAKGINQIDGIPAKIKYLFQNEFYHNPAFSTDKKVNLLDHTIIPSVNIDEVLAVKLDDPISGKDGISVTGEILKSKEGKDISLKVGKGAALIDEGIPSI